MQVTCDLARKPGSSGVRGLLFKGYLLRFVTVFPFLLIGGRWEVLAASAEVVQFSRGSADLGSRVMRARHNGLCVAYEDGDCWVKTEQSCESC